MDNVILTKAQAQVIERLLKRGCTREELVHDHILSGKYIEEDKALRDMSPDKLIRALYIGYEIELTVEQKLLQQYEMHISSDDRKYRGIAIGIRMAAEIVGIKVPGMYA
ncbi:hypothetical protein [Paenibacillus ottowii]|uniref:Uncharacterized protein n=1 Tax=Paenibacillus ottowii TaxID=2315729 RepID=A0ABY3B0Y8_9BACL|nr:hypothetical protein [Paenibacillus ottowii]TQR97348.1 hypothetical protein FKV70_19135 [Paenibacillus ottowii]